ncbi:helix-turn-helix domain-containing protein [Kordiimonas aestuarii]|uniref:helix-turn-helix domain-containing protein n=1 Tax=Kordiimonas aestuarii TaxID=1005925 RepID=UPI0021CE9102|nr:helix-turn-helix domain-containing protein [Kordiimonas aestuarii]
MTNEKKTVGELLEEARIACGRDIDTIAKDICVRSGYLSAIEAGKHDALPGNTFAIGFVRAYAKALSLDAEAIAQAFKDELGVKTAPVMAEGQRPAIHKPIKTRRRLPAWLSPLGGIVGAALVWAFMGNTIAPFTLVADNEIVDPATDSAQLIAVQAKLEVAAADLAAHNDGSGVSVSVDDILSTDPAHDETVKATGVSPLPHSLFLPAANAMPTASDGEGRSDILLSASEDAWVRLAKEDGTEIWSGVLREGQSYRPLLEGDVLLSTSNAAGVTLTVGNRQIKSLGERGEVVKGLSLDGEKLLSNAVQGSRTVTGSR